MWRNHNLWIKEDQIDWATTHEFGHALGAQHEQGRTDNPGTCAQNGDVYTADADTSYMTTYDPRSVMNYCSGRSRLSTLDIGAFRRYFNATGPTTCGGTVNVGDAGEECNDTNSECAAWAGSGECANNPGYMLSNCCVSCNAAAAPCNDADSRCGGWAASGECSKNPGYMATNCCSSCDAVAGTCSDTNSMCAQWASSGECSKNPGYMRTSCCLSCRGR